MRRVTIIYSASELAFVEARKHEPRVQLHAAFVAQFHRHDVSVDNIKALCTRMGWSTRDAWTDDEVAVVRDHFPFIPTEVVAAELGRSASAVSQVARKLSLRKDPEYLVTAGRIQKGERRGTATEFKKGTTPANKGVKRGRGWAPGRMGQTQFKPRQKSWLWKPIGSTRIVDGYEYTKVNDVPNVVHTVNWKATHLLRWEAVHGPVPAGHALKCLDGNRLNADPANWECVPRGVLAHLNGGRTKKRLAYDAAPVELKPTVLAVAKLLHAAKQRRAA